MVPSPNFCAQITQGAAARLSASSGALALAARKSLGAGQGATAQADGHAAAAQAAGQGATAQADGHAAAPQAAPQGAAQADSHAAAAPAAGQGAAAQADGHATAPQAAGQGAAHAHDGRTDIATKRVTTVQILRLIEGLKTFKGGMLLRRQHRGDDWLREIELNRMPSSHIDHGVYAFGSLSRDLRDLIAKNPSETERNELISKLDYLEKQMNLQHDTVIVKPTPAAPRDTWPVKSGKRKVRPVFRSTKRSHKAMRKLEYKVGDHVEVRTSRAPSAHLQELNSRQPRDHLRPRLSGADRARGARYRDTWLPIARCSPRGCSEYP